MAHPRRLRPMLVYGQQRIPGSFRLIFPLMGKDSAARTAALLPGFS